MNNKEAHLASTCLRSCFSDGESDMATVLTEYHLVEGLVKSQQVDVKA